jgi:hypothetical protein
MEQVISTLTEIQSEAEKWSTLHKQYPDITTKRNEKFLQTFHPDDFLTDLLLNLQQMNSSYENKIRVRNQVGEFLTRVEELQKSLKHNRDYYCKIDKYGYININNSFANTTFYVFEYNQQDNNFRQLRFFHSSNMGRCNVYRNSWDKNYFQLFDDGIPVTNEDKLEFYDVDQFFTSDEILAKLEKDFN